MTLSTKHGLQKHSKSVHKKIRDFSCKICTLSSSQKKFVVKQILNKHTKQVHFDIRPIQCDICVARNLQKHMPDKHVALKDQHCGRAFRELQDLESHMQYMSDIGARNLRQRAKLERRCEETGYVIISLKGPKSTDGIVTYKETPTFAECSKPTRPSKTISDDPKDSGLEVHNQTLGYISKDENRMRERQSKETPAQREDRLQNQRRNYQLKMTPELRKLEADRKRKSRANETPEEREHRLQKRRDSTSQEFRQKDARRKREERQQESQAKRAARLASLRIYKRIKREAAKRPLG